MAWCAAASQVGAQYRISDGDSCCRCLRWPSLAAVLGYKPAPPAAILLPPCRPPRRLPRVLPWQRRRAGPAGRADGAGDARLWARGGRGQCSAQGARHLPHPAGKAGVGKPMARGSSNLALPRGPGCCLALRRAWSCPPATPCPLPSSSFRLHLRLRPAAAGRHQAHPPARSGRRPRLCSAGAGSVQVKGLLLLGLGCGVAQRLLHAGFENRRILCRGALDRRWCCHAWPRVR